MRQPRTRDTWLRATHLAGHPFARLRGQATSVNLDSAVVDAVIDAFGGTGKPYLQISGLWIYGANPEFRHGSYRKQDAINL